MNITFKVKKLVEMTELTQRAEQLTKELRSVLDEIAQFGQLDITLSYESDEEEEPRAPKKRASTIPAKRSRVEEPEEEEEEEEPRAPKKRASTTPAKRSRVEEPEEEEEEEEPRAPKKRASTTPAKRSRVEEIEEEEEEEEPRAPKKRASTIPAKRSRVVEEEEVSVDDIRVIMRKLLDAKGKGVVKDLLNGYGISKLSDLSEEYYSVCFVDVQNLLRDE